MVKKRFGIITVLLVLVIIFCVKGTVMSKENNERAKQNHYYAALEQDYLEKTRQILYEKGYKNCGINLTRVTYEDGRREYTVLLHHRRLDGLSDEEKLDLESKLSQIEFQNKECSFCYEL